MKSRYLLAFVGTLVLAALAAGVSSGTINYLGPIELVHTEDIGGVEYETISRHATIQDAIDAATGASSSNRYVVRVPPGIYTEQVTMTAWVDLVGSGVEETLITCACGHGSLPSLGATLTTASSSNVSHLSVANTGGAAYSVAIFAPPGDGTTVSHVSATATGGSVHHAIYDNGGDVIFTNVDAFANGGTSSTGITLTNSTDGSLEHVRAEATGATNSSGITITTAGTNVALRNVTASASGSNLSYGILIDTADPTLTGITASATNGTSGAYGLRLQTAADIVLTDAVISAKDGSNTYGLYIWGSSPLISNVTSTAQGGNNAHGIYNVSNAFPDFNHVTADAFNATNNYGMLNTGLVGAIDAVFSTFSGASDSVRNNAAYTVHFGGSWLDGPLNTTGTGSWLCAESYNSSRQPLDTDCNGTGSLLPPSEGGVSEPPVLPAPGE